MNKTNQKKFLYEIDPLFFCDQNNDGFGDFEGFLNKIDYFKYLNVDGVIIPDIFNQEEIILKNSEISIFDKYGNIKHLKKIINYFKENKIEFFVEIDINNFHNSSLTKIKPEDIKKIDIEKFIIVNKKNKNNYEDEAFKTIIDFWTKIGVYNFVFKNDNKNFINSVSYFKNFYNVTKNINSESNVGFRFFFLNKQINKKIFNENKKEKFFDFIIDSSFSLLGTKKNYEFDIMKKFKIKDLYRKIKNINFNSFENYFISFNNNQIGRINARWLKEFNFINESNKTLIMLQNFLPFSNINYYGDELGWLNIKIKSVEEYHDYDFYNKKRFLENKFNNFQYEKDQKFLSRINSQNFFGWNNEKNYGFSNKKNLSKNFPLNIQKYNLSKQFDDENSIFNFYKNSIDLIKNKLNLNEISNFKIKYKNKFIKFLLKQNEVKILCLINLNNKVLNKKISKKWSILLSSYNKNYDLPLNFLCPYESFLLIKNK